MREIILNFPKQFQIGIQVAKDIKIANLTGFTPLNSRKANLTGFKGIIVCGMGGSALPGDILEMWMNAHKIKIPLYIHRSYNLPYFVDKNYLIIVISYSGNTEETLTAFEKAIKEKLSVVAITSGGRLAELCEKNKIPLVKVPSGIIPRMAIGYHFAALMKVLTNSGLVKNELKKVLALEKKLIPEKLEKTGQKLAKKLIDKIPVIYSSSSFKGLSKIWKINFNENSKTIAFFDYFPEMCHNEIVGFERGIDNKKIQVIILRDQEDLSQIFKQMEIIKEILSRQKVNPVRKGLSNGVKVEFIDLIGDNILEKIFSNIILAFWVSYWLAKEYNIEPIQTKTIEEFKKKI